MNTTDASKENDKVKESLKNEAEDKKKLDEKQKADAKTSVELDPKDNTSAGKQSEGTEPKPTTAPATVKTEAERVEIERSPIADAINKEITGPAREASGSVVSGGDNKPVEASERQHREAQIL